MRTTRIAGVLLCLGVAARATEPFEEVSVTGTNANRLDFVVSFATSGRDRILRILAPRTARNVCIPSGSWLWLHAADGVVLMEQRNTIGPPRTGPEMITTLHDRSHYVIVWAFYKCPDGHNPNGIRFEVDTREWQTAAKAR
jgi:hypothetical protein